MAPPWATRLIDGFIEPGEIVQVAQVVIAVAVALKPNDAGEQGAVFGDQFSQIESRTDPTDTVDLGRSVEACAVDANSAITG